MNSLPSPSPIVLYIVGTYHFNGAPYDVVDTGAHDVLAPPFQSQIKEVVEGLQKSGADKVFVEWKTDQQPFVDLTYAEYLKNEFILGTNEVYQLGYRLAKLLGHSRVYCADAEGEWEYDKVLQYADEHNQSLIINKLFTHGSLDEAGKQIAQRTGGARPPASSLAGSLAAQLRSLNAEEANLSTMDSYLLGLARVGSHEYHPGADLVGEVFKRNVKIYYNILKEVNFRKDKSLVLIIGHGHVAFLKSILKYNSLFVLGNAAALLP